MEGLTRGGSGCQNCGMKNKLPLAVLLVSVALIPNVAVSVELPVEKPLWVDVASVIRYDVDEQVRSQAPPKGSPSGFNRVYSYVSTATYSIHRPENPNGVGLVICPGGAYRDVWLDREGHDLAIWLKQHGVTSLVLKYRTNSGQGDERGYAWEEYLPVVESDARQAIRILRRDAETLGLETDKIGIGGFSAGGNLALLASLHTEPQHSSQISGMPDFAGLFYPWFREDYRQLVARRAAAESPAQSICPMFVMNATDDRMTPADKCVDFCASLIGAGVNTELHLFSKGSHGFDLGIGRGESAALWPQSFVAWLRDTNLIED